MKKFAVIVAAGNGVRMSSDVPKQFLLVKGKAVLWYTLNTFLHAYDDMHIILVLQDQYIETGKTIVHSLNAQNRVIITGGGETRFHSVKNGLVFVEHPSVVFVHDGVRCLISEKQIRACYEETMIHENAIPSIKSVDSLRMEMNDGNKIIDRNKVRIVQTPQTFKSEIIIAAFKKEYDETFTDEATVVESMGVRINLIEGEKNNIKITQPVDLMIAEKILEKYEVGTMK